MSFSRRWQDQASCRYQTRWRAVSVSKESGSGYGGIRVFASIGWIITVLAAGWLIERFDFIAGFIGVSSMWTLGALLLFFIQLRYFINKRNDVLPKPSLTATLKCVASDRTLLGFAVALIFIGFMNSGVCNLRMYFYRNLARRKG